MKSYSIAKYILAIFFLYLIFVNSFLTGCSTEKIVPKRQATNGQASPGTISEINTKNCSKNTLFYNTPKNSLCSLERKKNRYQLKVWQEESGWKTNVESWKTKKNEKLDNFTCSKTGAIFACLKTYKRKKLEKQDVVKLCKNGKIQSLSLIGLKNVKLKGKSKSITEITKLQACDTSLAITYQYGAVKIYNIAEGQALGATNITGSADRNIFYELHYLTIAKNNASQELLLNNYDIRSGEITYSFTLGGNGQDSTTFSISNYQNELYLLTPKGIYVGKCDDTTLTRKMDYSSLQLPANHHITYWQAARDKTFYLGYETSDKTFHLQYFNLA